MSSPPPDELAGAGAVAMIACRCTAYIIRPGLPRASKEMPMARRSQTDLTEFCRETLDAVGLIPPFTAWQLCEQVSVVRGRRIRVHAANLGGVAVIGHLVALPKEDRILHDSRASSAQQQLIIYHEVMHLLLGHLDDGIEPLTCGSLLSDPDGDNTSVERYSEDIEWEAEAGATTLMRLGTQRHLPNEYVATDGWNGERGVAAALGLVSARWRLR